MRTNLKQIFFVGHNLDPKKVFIFTSITIFNICLQYESSSKRVFKILLHFTSRISNSCKGYIEEEGLHAISKLNHIMYPKEPLH